jgi:hypothetical protein
VEVNTDRLQRALLTPELQKELARDFRSKPNQPTSPKGLPTEQKAAPSFEERWRTFRSQATDAPCGIYDVEERFRRWMYLPDAGILHVTLGTIAANLLPESSPTWLMIVGPPGGGKTEFTKPCSRLPGIHYAATLTEAALLSGSAKRDRTADASGGLLREIGEFGFLICKDFTSILSMNRDARASTLAALREVYDGRGASGQMVGVPSVGKARWDSSAVLLRFSTSIIRYSQRWASDLSTTDFPQVTLNDKRRVQLRMEDVALKRPSTSPKQLRTFFGVRRLNALKIQPFQIPRSSLPSLRWLRQLAAPLNETGGVARLS